MGASKRAMEILLLHAEQIPHLNLARFANVAYSDGSLLAGFQKRFEKRQPISAPNDIQRYFISHQQAASLCLLSAFTGRDKEIFFPCNQNILVPKNFSTLASDFLKERGFDPMQLDSEKAAMRAPKN